MQRTQGVLLFCVAAILSSGCTLHNIKYQAFAKNPIEPTELATAVDGNFEEAKALFEQAKLPHNTARQRLQIQLRALKTLTSQLGSDEYVLIGEVYGGGNARASLETLKQAFCKKAARKGGDVVMMFNYGIQERPFVYTTPGYSTTNVYGSAYSYGNYAYGSATGHTTYNPGQTYAGVLSFPYGNGLVFKHVPGAERRRRALMALSDEALENALEKLEEIGNNRKITFEEALQRCDEIIAGSAHLRAGGF